MIAQGYPLFATTQSAPVIFAVVGWRVSGDGIVAIGVPLDSTVDPVAQDLPDEATFWPSLDIASR